MKVYLDTNILGVQVFGGFSTLSGNDREERDAEDI